MPRPPRMLLLTLVAIILAFLAGTGVLLWHVLRQDARRLRLLRR